jgi:hypothetical protein
MTEHQRETAFLRRLMVLDTSGEGRKLEKRIAQVQLDERCVKRVAWLMALLISLSAVGLAYGAVLVEDFPYGKSQLVLKFIYVLGLASLICLAAFACLLMAYRRKSNGLREECRQLITKLLEPQLGKPRPLPGAEMGAFQLSQYTHRIEGATQPSANGPSRV